MYICGTCKGSEVTLSEDTDDKAGDWCMRCGTTDAEEI